MVLRVILGNCLPRKSKTYIILPGFLNIYFLMRLAYNEGDFVKPVISWNRVFLSFTVEFVGFSKFFAEMV